MGEYVSFPNSSISVDNSSSESVEPSLLIKSLQLLHMEIGTEIMPPSEGDAKTLMEEGAILRIL